MNKNCFGIIPLLVAVSVAQGVEYRLPSNQTQVRESNYEIRTIMFDVVSPTNYVNPGKLVQGAGDITIQLRKDTLWREELVSGTEDEDDRLAMHINLRTKAWKIQTELKAAIVDADAYGGTDVSSVSALTVWPLYATRYGGASIAVGAEFSGGDGEAFDIAVSDTEKYVLEFRLSEHIGMHTILFNIGAGMYRDGIVTMDFARTNKDGEAIPAGEFEHDFVGLNAGFAWTWRSSRFMRNGIDLSATWSSWDGENAELKDSQFIASFFTELNFNENLSLRIGAGLEPDRDDDIEESLAIDVALLTRF